MELFAWNLGLDDKMVKMKQTAQKGTGGPIKGPSFPRKRPLCHQKVKVQARVRIRSLKMMKRIDQMLERVTQREKVEEVGGIQNHRKAAYMGVQVSQQKEEEEAIDQN